MYRVKIRSIGSSIYKTPELGWNGSRSELAHDHDERLQTRLSQYVLEGIFVAGVFRNMAVALVAGFLPDAFGFLAEKEWHVCLRHEKDDDGKTDTTKNSEDPVKPSKIGSSNVCAT